MRASGFYKHTLPVEENSVKMMELKLQMRRLELDHERNSNEREQQKERELQEREQRQKQLEMQVQFQERREREERDVAREPEERQHQLELRKLELQASQTHPVAAPRYSGSSFRVDSAVKLIPRFNENDVETFLISFEKIAQLNNFPEDKYAAVLQAHLTGKH